MQTFIAVLEDKFEYNQRFLKLSFELKEPHRIDFKAGQYLTFTTHPEEKKQYFFFSSPDIDHGFEILLDRDQKGKSTTYLEQLPVGEQIELTAPHGTFVIDDSDSELILIADGGGIAPLYSMVLDLLQAQQTTRKITLYWGLENLDQLFLQEDLTELEENFPHFDFHPVMGQSLPEWTLCRGSVYDCLSIHEINADADFYICADQKVTEKTKKLCLENGVTLNQVHSVEYPLVSSDDT
jgi:Na+-transporting NADH:ubiquinone oxidoreductase subunit F